jgi:hypothetical protein
MDAFDALGGKKEAGARKRRRIEGGENDDDDSAAIKAQLEAWDVTSYFSLPREERWVIIWDLQFNYKTKRVSDPKARLEAHDKATASRLQAKAEHHVRLVLNRAGPTTTRSPVPLRR